tara:strand:+ start:381 stop:734 length:354 start_codon:yes stop_codon:yes gene_type:complete
MTDFKMNVGSRAQVMHGTARRTSGGLTRNNLKYNKNRAIVSIRASNTAKKNNRLVKAGFVTRKGVFGVQNMAGGQRKKSNNKQRKQSGKKQRKQSGKKQRKQSGKKQRKQSKKNKRH